MADRVSYASFDHYDIIRVRNPITGNIRETYVCNDLWDRVLDASGRFVHKSNILEA